MGSNTANEMALDETAVQLKPSHILTGDWDRNRDPLIGTPVNTNWLAVSCEIINNID